MIEPITLYTLNKEEVWADSPHNFQFYEEQNNFRNCSLLFPHGEPVTAADGTTKKKYTVPIRHCGHITPAGGKVDEYYALHPQLQELFERELRRMEYLDAEIVNNIRAEDSRVIGALSEKICDLDESLKLVCKANETLDQRNREWCRSCDGFTTAPLWRRLYVAIFSPNSIFPSWP